MKRICAWCRAVLEEGDGSTDQITHGICRGCLDDQLACVYDGSLDLGGEGGGA